MSVAANDSYSDKDKCRAIDLSYIGDEPYVMPMVLVISILTVSANILLLSVIITNRKLRSQVENIITQLDIYIE